MSGNPSTSTSVGLKGDPRCPLCGRGMRYQYVQDGAGSYEWVCPSFGHAIPTYASRRLSCMDHIYDDEGLVELPIGARHDADLICEASGKPICGDAHIGHDCGCDYFDLVRRKYASELNPEGYE